MAAAAFCFIFIRDKSFSNFVFSCSSVFILLGMYAMMITVPVLEMLKYCRAWLYVRGGTLHLFSRGGIIIFCNVFFFT